MRPFFTVSSLVTNARAERRLGGMLAESPRAQGKRTDLVQGGNQVNDAPTLADMGIDKKLSSRAQQTKPGRRRAHGSH
jgi:hypothetical protein